MELGDRDVSHVCVPTAHIVSHTEHTGVGRAGGDGTGQSDPPRAAVPVRQWAVAECAAEGLPGRTGPKKGPSHRSALHSLYTIYFKRQQISSEQDSTHSRLMHAPHAHI